MRRPSFWPEKRSDENDKVVLTEWSEHPRLSQSADLNIGGFGKTVEYFRINLLRKPVGDRIRKDGDDQSVLMCPDLPLPAPDIITMYMFRSRTEVMSLSMRHVLGGFYYHFRTMAFPKNNTAPEPDFSAFNEKKPEKIKNTFRATELFINHAGIAPGRPEYIALKDTRKVWENYGGWFRTCSSAIPSERMVQSVIRTEIIASLPDKVPNNRTLRIIRNKMRESLITGNSSGGLPMRTYDWPAPNRRRCMISSSDYLSTGMNSD